MKKIVIILLTLILFGCMDKTDERGFYIEGEKNGYHKETKTIYDKQGYDKEGYDKDGYNKSGYDKEGYNRDGINREGYDKQGYNILTGYNKQGYDRDGYNKNGYDENGLDRNGYDKNKKFNKELYIERSFEKGFNIKNNYEQFTEMAISFMKVNEKEFLKTKLKKDEFEKTIDFNKRQEEFTNNLKKIKKDIENNIYQKIYLFDSSVSFVNYNADKEEWELLIPTYLPPGIKNDFDYRIKNNGYIHPDYEIQMEYLTIWEIKRYNFGKDLSYKMPLNEAKLFDKNKKLRVKYIYKITDFSIRKEEYKDKTYYGNFWRTYNKYIYFETKILGYRLFENDKLIKEVIY